MPTTMPKRNLAEKATKAMFGVIKEWRLQNLSINCQISLFDKIFKPMDAKSRNLVKTMLLNKCI